jgi:C4-dicarboxylate transporter, DctM subunit
MEIPLPFLVFGGIYSGLFTVTQAACISALYALIVEVFILKEIKIGKELFSVIVDSMVLVGSILMILAAALGFTSFLVDQQIPMKILNWMQHYIHSKYVFLIFLNLFLLVVGCLMDIFSAIIIIVPLIDPIARGLGIDPFHLGAIFLTNLEIGYSTPPIGLNLFIASRRFNKSIISLYNATIPFLGIFILLLFLITFIPGLSLWLLRM